VVALGCLLLIGGLAGTKFLQISRLIAFGKQMEAAGPPPESVSAAVAEIQTWETTLNAVGTVARARSVEIRNEVPGVVQRIAFNSGTSVDAGALLVELDASVERSQLVAARARRIHARATLQRSVTLLRGGAISQAELDVAEAAAKVAEGEVASLNARIDQKVITAPFAGRLGIREVHLGQFLPPGSKITVLDSLGEVFVDFALPQEERARVDLGMPVRVSFRASPKSQLTAELVAVEPTVDARTRNLELRARLVDEEGRLHPGMFVDVEVVMPQRQDVVTVPATAIVHASYGNSVFVVEDKKPGSPGMDRTPDGKVVRIAHQTFVRVGAARGDFVQIVQGLKPGAEVVTAGAFKLRNLSPVVVEKAPAPKPELNPRPENR
jgi:membrane fusion protein (multidrug efflux system)